MLARNALTAQVVALDLGAAAQLTLPVRARTERGLSQSGIGCQRGTGLLDHIQIEAVDDTRGRCRVVRIVLSGGCGCHVRVSFTNRFSVWVGRTAQRARARVLHRRQRAS
jgi:hypothetical protein